MSRRTAVLALAAVAVTSVALPASAAKPKPKPKPKPITGSYSVTQAPDPLINVLAQAEVTGCQLLKDDHAFTAPAKGLLEVKLTSADPTPAASPVHADWDLYVLDAQGVVASSTSEFATESVTVTVGRKTNFTFEVCNASGEPSATVAYTFTYK